MRQISIGDFQMEANRMMHTHVVRIDAPETGDVNRPAWVESTTQILVHLQPATLAQKQSTDGEYENPVTHAVYCENHEDLVSGSSLVPVETTGYGGGRRFIPITDLQRFLILGKQVLASGASPVGEGARHQVLVNLYQISVEA